MYQYACWRVCDRVGRPKGLSFGCQCYHLPDIPAILPIHPFRDRIIAALTAPGALVLAAPTGRGKSTQVPKFLLEQRREFPGRTLVLQPRRIAARSLAARVASETGTVLGREIGYQVRFDSRSGRNTAVVFQTCGVASAGPCQSGLPGVCSDRVPRADPERPGPGLARPGSPAEDLGRGFSATPDAAVCSRTFRQPGSSAARLFRGDWGLPWRAETCPSTAQGPAPPAAPKEGRVPCSARHVRSVGLLIRIFQERASSCKAYGS